MARTNVFNGLRRICALVTGLSLAAFATPAFANSSANAADITAPLRAAQAAAPATSATEDEEFRKIFNSWQDFEKSSVPALAAVAEATSQAGLTQSARRAQEFNVVRPLASVSIPSLMPLRDARTSSGFGMRTHPVMGGRRAHKGIDLAAPTGTPIYATADGLVSKASYFGAYGLYVAIEHGGQIQTRYAHMSRLNVAEGQRVRKGEVIGFVGSTGRSTGPHLHYEVRIDGKAVNPLPYMNVGG